MMYDEIYNNPTERMRITYPYCFMDNAFTENELETLCHYLSKQELKRATVLSADANSDITKSIRRSNISFVHKDVDNHGIFEKLNGVIKFLNCNYYNFDLNGYDSFQYTEYDESDMGKYDFHMDLCLGGERSDSMIETRKLSIVMCLNRPGVDFEGGQFYINQGSEKDAFEVEMKKGRLIAFPSFLIHRVAPVTKGKRKSLVIWVMGPKFR